MGFLSIPKEPEKSDDELVAEALRAYNRRPKFVDTSAHRHKSVAERVSLLLAFQKPKTTGAVGKPTNAGELPKLDDVQDAYANL